MKKRLRKKKRLAEYTELGFAMGFRIPDDLEVAERNALLDSFIEEAIEGAGLQFGGGGASVWHGFVTLDEPGGSASEEDREAIRNWLAEQPLVLAYFVGPIEDAWRARPENDDSNLWKVK